MGTYHLIKATTSNEEIVSFAITAIRSAFELGEYENLSDRELQMVKIAVDHSIHAAVRRTLERITENMFL